METEYIHYEEQAFFAIDTLENVSDKERTYWQNRREQAEATLDAMLCFMSFEQIIEYRQRVLDGRFNGRVYWNSAFVDCGYENMSAVGGEGCAVGHWANIVYGSEHHQQVLYAINHHFEQAFGTAKLEAAVSFIRVGMTPENNRTMAWLLGIIDKHIAGHYPERCASPVAVYA